MAKKRRAKTVKRGRAVDKRIVKDRVSFLESVAGDQVFKSTKDARQFANIQLLETGIVYTVTGKQRTARYKRVDFDAVKNSSSMKQIRNDLRLKSRSARGRKAKALEALGRRENFFDWPVGETPS